MVGLGEVSFGSIHDCFHPSTSICDLRVLCVNVKNVQYPDDAFFLVSHSLVGSFYFLNYEGEGKFVFTHRSSRRLL